RSPCVMLVLEALEGPANTSTRELRARAWTHAGDGDLNMSGLAHFADSSRTSPEVRGVPNSDYSRVGWAPRFRETDVTELFGVASFGLRAGELDNLAPLFGFLSDQLAEVRRRTSQQRAAELDQPCL